MTWFNRCPRTGRITGIHRASMAPWAFILAGLAACIWYLLRVFPRPARAAYPCMTNTAPLRIAFLAWIAGVLVSALALVKARRAFAQSRWLVFSASVLAAGLCIIVFIGVESRDAGAAFIPMEPAGQVANNPIGEARGIFPGRVVWVHEPEAAAFDGGGNWWDDGNNDQAAADGMVVDMVRVLSGMDAVSSGWDRIFKSFNAFHDRGSAGYAAGERIAIKVNQNNTSSHNDTDQINANPFLVLALLRSLVEDAEVPQDMITVYDASRFITNNIYDKCHAVYPDVIFVDHSGGDGRVQSQYAAGAIDYSVNNGALATGLATCVTEATYLINMAILKGHVGQGITFCAKNMYGMTSIDSNWQNNAHNNFDPDANGNPRYMTFTDWMAHGDMGEKTLLWMLDAIYPTEGLAGVPADRWNMAPFNGHWPASILASQDGVAVDSVGLDFFRMRWPGAPDMEYADQYLHEAALADAPPSGTVYDPDGDGPADSLGAHEHWNNETDRQYSRNLGTGDGIELIHIAAHHIGDLNCDGVVGFGDINPFVLYLSNFATWQATYVDCLATNGDINGDGVFPSFADINPFVMLLSGG